MSSKNGSEERRRKKGQSTYMLWRKTQTNLINSEPLKSKLSELEKLYEGGHQDDAFVLLEKLHKGNKQSWDVFQQYIIARGNHKNDIDNELIVEIKSYVEAVTGSLTKAMIKATLGFALVKLKNHDSAKEMFRSALTTFTFFLGENSQAALGCKLNLAKLIKLQRDKNELN